MIEAREPMRARRHPRAIFFSWAFVALSGLALAWPAAAGVGREFRASPDGDAPLFRPGALDLLDYLWRARGVISADLGHIVVLFPLTIIAAVVPLATLLAAISRSHRPSLASRAGRMFGVLVILDVATLAIQAATFWALFTIAAMTAAGLQHALGEKRAELAGAAVLALGALLVIALSIVRDLASTTAVASPSGVLTSLGASLRLLNAHAVSLLWAWLWRTGIGWVPIALGVIVATRIGGKSGLFLLVLTITHQAALAWKVAWRASWLAASLRQAADDEALVSDR